jgi:hypothetical protein
VVLDAHFLACFSASGNHALFAQTSTLSRLIHRGSFVAKKREGKRCIERGLRNPLVPKKTKQQHE